MSFIPTGYGEVSVEITIPGDAGPAYNVFGVDPGTPNDISNTADAIETALSSASGYRALLATGATVQGFVYRERLDATNVAIEERTIGLAGVQPGTLLTPQVALLIQKITGLAGRQNRGRMYMPTLAEDNVDDGGFLIAGALSAFQAAADQFDSDLDLSAVPMTILHTSPAVTPSQVSSLQVSPKVATQRRRLR